MPVFPLVLFLFSRDREGHVKQKASRREPPLLMDVTLCVGVILPDVDKVEEDEDDTDDETVDVVIAESPCSCCLL